ncbi:U-box domain-containing protein 12 (Plant U-box protein 12) (OsPUB12) (RING-type E3 ubiquitin transferase PUB12), partial [Durusdinium trenchii]
APPGPQVTVSEPVPVVLELLKHDSKEVCERALGLVDALVSSNPLHRDAVWHHGGIPLVVQLLKSGPAEQLQRACSLLKTLASSQKEAQMAVAWAGAIPFLVNYLNHDLGALRVEAAKALWSLAQNNVDNQTSILQHHGLQRLVPLLHGGAKDAQEPTLLLLLALAQGHEQQDNITRAGALVPLIDLLGDESRLELAAAVLAQLANHHADNQSAIGAATGAVPKLSLG